MVLTSYALVRRDAEAMRQVDWLGVALDEAQNIKNPKPNRRRSFAALPAGFRLALTGTPVENRLSELWSIMQFLNPGFLGGQKKFRQEFTLPIEKYGDEDATKRLRQLTRPFILRRLKTDPTVITDLPDKQEVKVYCHLSEEQATLYEAVVQDALQAIEAQGRGRHCSQRDGVEHVDAAQAGVQPSRPIPASRPKPTIPSRTTIAAANCIASTPFWKRCWPKATGCCCSASSRRWAACSSNTSRSDLAYRRSFCTAACAPKSGPKWCSRFQSDDGPPVFVLSLKAGGTGLNLTNANHVFHFDRWWNPAVEDQATDRAFRIGQTQKCSRP